VVAGPVPSVERLGTKHAKRSWWQEHTSGAEAVAAWLVGKALKELRQVCLSLAGDGLHDALGIQREVDAWLVC
jgi:hypothetical protein